jgi:hypothetical protein
LGPRIQFRFGLGQSVQALFSNGDLGLQDHPFRQLLLTLI